MFPHGYFVSGYFAPVYYPPVVAAATQAGSKGRRLARWVINAPWIPSPVADWVRQRDDDEILLLG